MSHAAPRGHSSSERSKSLLRGYSTLVTSCAFSKDGKTVLSGSYDNTLKLWDVGTGKEKYTLRGHSSSVYCCAFSKDGQTVLSGSADKTLKLWDVGTGKEKYTLSGHSDSVKCCAFSPDGQTVLSGSRDNTLKLWDVGTGTEKYTLSGHSNEVTSCAFSKDGQTVLSGSRDKTLKLWDVGTGTEKYTLRGHSGPVTSCAFSPDGQTVLSGSGDKTLKLWDVGTGAEKYTLSGHSDRVNCCAFSPDGHTVLSGSGDKTLKLWDVGSGAKNIFSDDDEEEGASAAGWAAEEAARRRKRKAEAAARRQREAEEAARRQREAEEAARRQREAEAAARRQREAEEAARRQRAAEEAARRQREAEEAARRQREAEAAARRQREAEEAAREQRAAEAAAATRAAEEAVRQQQEAAAAAAAAARAAAEEAARRQQMAEEIAAAEAEAASLLSGLTAAAIAPGGTPCEVGTEYVRRCAGAFAASRALGQPGAFGVVFRAVDPSVGAAWHRHRRAATVLCILSAADSGAGVRFAVKRLSADLQEAGRSAQREIEILSAFRHDNVIRLWGYTTDPACRCLLYELADRGALSENLSDGGKAAALTWRLRIRATAGVALALNYLHCSQATPAMHMDVKSANIVLSADFEPKLIDCGLSRLLRPEQAGRGFLTQTSAFQGTPGYICPSYMECGKVDTQGKADVYAFGVVLCEVYTGRLQMGCACHGLPLWTGPAGECPPLCCVTPPMLNLAKRVARKPGGLAQFRDARAGAWDPTAAAAMEAAAIECLEEELEDRPAMMPIMRRLRDLRAAHCAAGPEEALLAAELKAARGALEALRVAAETEEVAALTEEQRPCCVCFDDAVPLRRGLDCGRGHFTCGDCLYQPTKYGSSTDLRICNLRGHLAPPLYCHLPRTSARP